ncbi:response regulator [Terrabacter aerolatus]|uniref:Transcriptional regulator n=1 Tax=Terrabacter aerolatus TaxID=422442 RepID=A0A512D5V6_9MICO|nr:transcriptional regulator [Terrabacter aerolatus]
MSTDESTTPKPTPATGTAPTEGADGVAATEAATPTELSGSAPASDSGAAQGATRILVAEDEALIRLDLVEMLGEQGYDVVGQASNGEQAVELAKEVKPDLVIMDVKMPILDGLSAAEQLHEAKLCPVIMLTAFSQTELVERARDAGVMAYIVKPFTADDLRPAIDIATSRWQELKALEAEIADLGERLETRKLVDRAKGVLMTQLKLSESDAFRWIQKTAMDRRLGMKEVAEAVINGFPAA